MEDKCATGRYLGGRRPLCCPVSGDERRGHCDDDDEDEDGQTDGDPDLLLHRNKENFI